MFTCSKHLEANALSDFLGRLNKPNLGYLPIKTVSITVIGKSQSISLLCGTYAISFLILSTFCPSNVTSPLSRGISPREAFIKVDLPAPFGPITPINIRVLNSNDILLTTSLPCEETYKLLTLTVPDMLSPSLYILYNLILSNDKKLRKGNIEANLKSCLCATH